MMFDSETETNPCKADMERRKRAFTDCGLTEHIGNMKRSISFEVGYDHMEFPEAYGGGGHGRHGMGLRFVLSGPAGATQWLCWMTNWYPGNIAHGRVDSTEKVSLVPIRFQQLGDAMAVDLGHHSPTPSYEGQDQTPCEHLPEGYCYYDGSGLNAEPVLEAFLAHGPHAVWATLARYYQEVFGHQEEPA